MLLNAIKKIKLFTTTLKFKIIFWYIVIFTTSSAVIFLLSYYFLNNSIVKKEKKELADMVNQYKILYETKNFSLLKNRVYAPEVKYNYFVIIEDKGKIILKNIPKNWNDRFFNYKKLLDSEKVKFIKVKSEDDPDDYFNVAYMKYGDKLFAVGEIFEELDDLLENFMDVSLILFSIILIIGILGGYIITNRLISPIDTVITTMDKIAASRDFSIRINKNITTALELNRLIEIFNLMLERIDKLVNGMKTSLDYVAHDLKTPITRLKNRAYSILIEKHPKIENCKEALIKAIEESEEIIKMLDSIMTLSEAEAGSSVLNLEKIDLRKIIDEIVEIYEFIA